MIQRKQTIYLLLAIVCFVITVTLPLGYLVPEGMGVRSTINCLGVVSGESGQLDLSAFMCIPCVLLALNILHTGSIIFMYKNRKSQMTNCYTQVAAIIVEYIVCGALIWHNCVSNAQPAVTYDTAFGICLPIIAIILILLAHKGIMDDERLVRAADRIR